ncbi:hypothetical protein Tco_0620038 [Tanacetum coccineum]
MRVNHQNFSNSRRNFIQTAVLTKSGIVPVSAARPINTVAPKSFVNVAKTRPNAFQKSHSSSRRPFYQQTALKNRVTSVVGEQEINTVKSSACWVWRPKINVLDHVSKNSGSYISKQFCYVDPTGILKSIELVNHPFSQIDATLRELNSTICGRCFVNRMREEAQTARNLIAQFNALIAEMEALEDKGEVYDTLMYLRDDKRGENTKLMGLNDLITQAEEEIESKEAHVEMIDAASNSG